jgi:hypothetical protein
MARGHVVNHALAKGADPTRTHGKTSSRLRGHLNLKRQFSFCRLGSWTWSCRIVGCRKYRDSDFVREAKTATRADAASCSSRGASGSASVQAEKRKRAPYSALHATMSAGRLRASAAGGLKMAR